MAITLATVNLESLSPDRAKAFYIDGLGMTERADRSHGSSFFYLSSGGCDLTIASPEHPRIAGIELGFATDDVEAARTRMERIGQQVIMQSMGWGDAFEARDSDGHRVIVYRLRER